MSGGRFPIENLLGRLVGGKEGKGDKEKGGGEYFIHGLAPKKYANLANQC